ncbi:MAG TPA: alpha-L-fucosidase [Gemmatimonadota bacterium]|nr:alpha-L-fucosidase [Gemmatimonadota bacterium]
MRLWQLAACQALLASISYSLPAESFAQADQALAVPPPRPVLPVPTARQLDWQRAELALFLHFGMNTFTDSEWGSGKEDPSLLNPTNLDANQWARVARQTGFRTLVLTAKHHDGFSLWPSRYTWHSVRRSPWRDGAGDVVRELADAARAEGLRVGLYLSPWDRHEPSYGEQRAYNEYYMAQLRELLTDYGPVAEVWFDGAKGPGAADMEYDFPAYWALVRQLQPGAVIFSDAGPDIRWIGNERGFAGATNWSPFDRTQVDVGTHKTDYLNSGDPNGPHWVPGECDVSIRPGWFWHPDQGPKPLDELLDIYFKSVGRNCVLLLNVPPNREGRLDDADVKRLYEFRAALDAMFEVDLARGGMVIASNVRGNAEEYGGGRALDGDLETYWATDDTVQTGVLELDLGQLQNFNVIRIQEPIQLGQRISAYRVEVERNGRWEIVSRGTTVGHKKLEAIEDVTTRRVRLVIEGARAHPLVAEFGLHRVPG